MLKILVTGGRGFFARNFQEQWSGRYEVLAPGSAELDLLDEDKVADFLKAHRFDLIVHTATWNASRNSHKDRTRILHNNCRMFFNIARCRGQFGRLINFGSGAQYDGRYYQPLMKEEYFDSHVPADDYGFSKYIMAKYTERVSNIYELRAFGVFGKYEDWEIRFISNACCKAVWDLPITIKQNVYFDYIYIDDLARLTEWFFTNEPEEQFYNVCRGESIDLYSLAKLVVATSGKKLDIVVAREGLGREYSGDNKRLIAEMGGYAFRPFEDAIKELYHWYEANKERIDREKLLVDK